MHRLKKPLPFKNSKHSAWESRLAKYQHVVQRSKSMRNTFQWYNDDVVAAVVFFKRIAKAKKKFLVRISLCGFFYNFAHAPEVKAGSVWDVVQVCMICCSYAAHTKSRSFVDIFRAARQLSVCVVADYRKGCRRTGLAS